MRKIPYNPEKHGDFDTEWGIHRNCREWWYATGILFDEDGNMYSCQYTLLHLAFGPVTPKVVMAALTDYKNHRHYYLQDMPKAGNIKITENDASVFGIATAHKSRDSVWITLSHKDFSLNVRCGYGKGRVWHCDNGKLQMGIPDRKATTLYYSWTNMPTMGTLQLNGRNIRVTGKTWFDKQGGTYNMADMRCHWEWFSLRFFDDEEAMIFAFSGNDTPYYDGTFIASDGSYRRMNTYTITATETIGHKGLLWSSKWKLSMPEKEGEYTIEPLQEGHMNFAYFEELCSVKNSRGELVGYAFAELLPGVLNKNLIGGKGNDISMKKLFTRVEF